MENNSVNTVKTISIVGLGYVGLPTSLAFMTLDIEFSA